MSLDTTWEATFPDRKRPKLYTSQSMNEDGFLPLNEPTSLVSDGIAGLTSAQLYALAANNADALVTAQQEWTSLEKLASQVKNRDLVSNPVKDPQALPHLEIFEEIKESILYGYKYNGSRQMIPARFTVSENVTDQEKFDCREPPEPFGQAGLIPNDKQYRTVMALAKTERRENNPDNLQPYRDNFAFEPKSKGMWLPRLPPREEPPPYKTRTRAEGQRMGLVEGGESRQTRFNGERTPVTRETSPLRAGANTPTGKRSGTPVGVAGSPAPKKRRLESDPEEASRRRIPNLNTRRGESEAFVNTNDVEATRGRHTSQYARRRDDEAYVPAPVMSRQATNHQQNRGPATQRTARPGGQALHASQMTNEEKRSHTFKDTELVEMIKQDHTWLNDDLALATVWRDRILQAEYPVRTWAMLRKWHEWKRDNRHKRPRNKQKVQEEEASDAGAEDNAPKRPSRLRRQFTAQAASPAPSSPLVNGISAQDIAPDTDITTVKNGHPADEISTQDASLTAAQDPISDDELQASQSSSATADEDDDYQDHTPSKAGTKSRRPQIITRSSYTNGALKAEKMARTRSSRSEQDGSGHRWFDGGASYGKRKPADTTGADAGGSARKSKLRFGRRGST